MKLPCTATCAKSMSRLRDSSPAIRWNIRLVASWRKPLAKGQFWFGYQFIKIAVVLDEQLEISVPREREVKLKSQTVQPTTREEAGRRHLQMENIESRKPECGETKRSSELRRFRGLLPPPDVLISRFRTWDEVGRWYEDSAARENSAVAGGKSQGGRTDQRPLG